MYYKARGLKCIIKHDVLYILESTMSHMSYKARGLKCIIKHDVLYVL